MRHRHAGWQDNANALARLASTLLGGSHNSHDDDYDCLLPATCHHSTHDAILCDIPFGMLQ